MNPIVYNLYDTPKVIMLDGSTSAFLLLLSFCIIILLLSFYLKKAFLGRNWQSNRCDYIFMSGFLQPDPSIKPHDYTLKNLKYCIKQTIYNDTPLLAHMKDSFDKIKYLMDFMKKQIGLYESNLKTNVSEQSTKYNEVMNSKINYLKHKQSNLQKIYNKLDENYKEITDKIETGVENKTLLDKENELNSAYQSDRYMNYSSK